MATTANAPTEAGLARWTASLPTNLMSILSNPFASADATANSHDAATNSKTDAHKPNEAAALKRPAMATVPNINQESRGPPSPSRSSGSIMFAEPESRSNSDAGSRDGSFDGVKRARKSARPKTQFSICHPPTESKTLQKLHRRPRSLLQFHKLSATSRPRPAFEIIPSINFSVRLNLDIAKVFKSKHSLCTNDLIVLKAETYHRKETDGGEEARDVVGLICKGKKDDEKTANGKAQIHLASGQVWEAYTTPTGGYEFFTTDEHGLGLTCRWVAKKVKDGKTAIKARKRFTFSTINPSSRRHPIIASLSNTGLDINDTYKMPDSAATPVATPRTNSTVLEDTMNEEEEQGQHETDNQLREIITLSAIWVVFKEGWSPNFRYEEKDGSFPSPTKTGTTPVNTPPGSPAQMPVDKRSSLRSLGSGIIRRTSVISKSARSSVYSIEPDDIQGPSRSASVISRTGRSRADSTSTVLVHRAASNRRKNNQQATWRPDLLTSKDPLQETSREDLRETNGTPTPKKTPKPSPLANSGTTVQRKESIARPLIPSTVHSHDGSGTQTATPARRQRSSVEKPEHRQSLGTDTSTSSATVNGANAPAPTSDAVRVNKKSKKGSGGGWRKLLCGISDV